MRDDRGCAIVEWRDAPQNYKRPVLELEETAAARAGAQDQRPGKATPAAEPFNPYERFGIKEKRTSAPRRDLRALSKWIQMMRELEERKARAQETSEPHDKGNKAR